MVKRKSKVSILQESAITASVSNETKIIEILESGGDLHSEVARSCWPDILGNYTDKEIKEKFNKTYRFDAKGVEFGVNLLFNKFLTFINF